MIFDFGKFVLDVDVDKTRELYRHNGEMTGRCHCQGCRNYLAWTETLAAEPKHTLEAMGVPPEKAPEVYVNCQFADGTLSYGGWYHLQGRILKGPDPWIREDGACQYLDREAFVYLEEHYRVTFTHNVHVREKNVSLPMIQMEIEAKLPFVLPEECTYGICDQPW